MSDEPASGAELTALAHLYRAEAQRSSSWRTRLDTTTNWAVVTLGVALSLTFSSPEASPLPLLLVGILIFVFLLIEARRYRYYSIWRHRARLLERGLFVPLLRGAPARPGWREDLARDLEDPDYHIGYLAAVGRRLRSNYLWIIGVQHLALAAKLAVHPASSSALADIAGRAAVGPLPGALVLASAGAYLGGLAVVAALTKWRDVHATRLGDEAPRG